MVTIFVLYLVDDLTTNVFTPARLTLAMGAAQHQATSNVPKPGDAQGSQTWRRESGVGGWELSELPHHKAPVVQA